MTTRNAAAEALNRQHMDIAQAIQLLTAELDSMPDPDSATWPEVARFARAADIARYVIEVYEEQ